MISWQVLIFAFSVATRITYTATKLHYDFYDSSSFCETSKLKLFKTFTKREIKL